MSTSNPGILSRVARLLGGSFVVFATSGLLLLLLSVVVIAIPLTRRLLFVFVSETLMGGWLESLAVDLEIQPGLKWLFTLLIVLPVGFGMARMATARDSSKSIRAMVLVLGILVGLGVVAWFQTDKFNFDAQGKPTVYISYRRDGAHKSFYPGNDRVTGRPKHAATPERAVWLTDLVKQPVRVVDPATETQWFDPNCGEPNLWYLEVAVGQMEFYNRPHFHSQLQLEVQPVTPSLMQEWQIRHQQQQQRLGEARRAREAAQAAERQRQLSESLREQAQRQAEDRTREQAELKEREKAREQSQLQAAAEALREQARQEALAQSAAEAAALRRGAEIEARRRQEAVALAHDLRWLDFSRMMVELCPNLTASSFQTNLCEEDYLLRRFRITDMVANAKSKTQMVTFPVRTYGQIHCVPVITVTPETIRSVREKKSASFAATLVSVRFSGNSTNINGIAGPICLLEFANGVAVPPAPVYGSNPKPKPAPTRQTDPYFTPMSNFRGNPPVNAVVGFTFENGVKLAFSPFVLLNKALGGETTVITETRTPYTNSYRVTYYK